MGKRVRIVPEVIADTTGRAGAVAFLFRKAPDDGKVFKEFLPKFGVQGQVEVVVQVFLGECYLLFRLVCASHVAGGVAWCGKSSREWWGCSLSGSEWIFATESKKYCRTAHGTKTKLSRSQSPCRSFQSPPDRLCLQPGRNSSLLSPALKSANSSGKVSAPRLERSILDSGVDRRAR